MDCDTARAALSAILDGETPGDQHEGDAVHEHLLTCPGCAAWHARALELREAALASSATEPPDLTERVLSAVREDGRRQEVYAESLLAGRRRILRIAVGVAAVVQLALAVPALLTATGITDFQVVHTSREMASFDIAVAVGFLLAALRPERAKAFVPVAVVLAVCLLFSSSLDVAQGMRALADETGHMVACVQAGLLWLLGRTAVRPPRPVTA
ncbi:zf-HC2 domain-containing protein [Actinorhabdospora filicis]|uniref:zf-HC2 domain-containing protein n=1 Tax=Actinorhabdospora filicis TaxID=1785913 RepID=UPI0025544E5C|nr:zf-HC2 domain-containing protein [Actinorhabdospora filicis]